MLCISLHAALTVAREDLLLESALTGPLYDINVLHAVAMGEGEYNLTVSLRKTIREDLWERAFEDHPLEDIAVRWKNTKIKMKQQVSRPSLSSFC